MQQHIPISAARLCIPASDYERQTFTLRRLGVQRWSGTICRPGTHCVWLQSLKRCGHGVSLGNAATDFRKSLSGFLFLAVHLAETP